MQETKSPQELLSAANIQNYDLRAESQPRQFPYRFSFYFAGDRYGFQITQEEVQEVSNAADLAGAALEVLVPNISRIVRGRVNSTSETRPHLRS
jgi:hypothetical protein